MTFARMFETDLAGLDVAILNAGIVKPDFEIMGTPNAGNLRLGSLFGLLCKRIRRRTRPTIIRRPFRNPVFLLNQLPPIK